MIALTKAAAEQIILIDYQGFLRQLKANWPRRAKGKKAKLK